jgi:NAD(P)-dependent dehydrogenase (short-subunit alcohol dehydrogenase family)
LIGTLGGTVVVHDSGVDREGVNPDASIAARVADEIVATGGTSLALTSDLGSPAACDDAVEATVARFGRLDSVIHSAGLSFVDAIDKIDEETFARLEAVNVDAAFHLCRAAFPVMRHQRYGRIVLTTSGHALEAGEDASGLTAYAMGKGAQLGLAMALAGEGLADEIYVNVISPAAKTRMMRRDVAPGRMTPEQVAASVAWLASSACLLSGVVLRSANGFVALAGIANHIELNLEERATDPHEVALAFERELSSNPRRFGLVEDTSS